MVSRLWPSDPGERNRHVNISPPSLPRPLRFIAVVFSRALAIRRSDGSGEEADRSQNFEKPFSALPVRCS